MFSVWRLYLFTHKFLVRLINLFNRLSCFIKLPFFHRIRLIIVILTWAYLLALANKWRQERICEENESQQVCQPRGLDVQKWLIPEAKDEWIEPETGEVATGD